MTSVSAKAAHLREEKENPHSYAKARPLPRAADGLHLRVMPGTHAADRFSGSPR